MILTERRGNGTGAVETRGYDDADRLTSRQVLAGTLSIQDVLQYDERDKLTSSTTTASLAGLDDDVRAIYDGLGTLVANERIRSTGSWKG